MGLEAFDRGIRVVFGTRCCDAKAVIEGVLQTAKSI